MEKEHKKVKGKEEKNSEPLGKIRLTSTEKLLIKMLKLLLVCFFLHLQGFESFGMIGYENENKMMIYTSVTLYS